MRLDIVNSDRHPDFFPFLFIACDWTGDTLCKNKKIAKITNGCFFSFPAELKNFW